MGRPRKPTEHHRLTGALAHDPGRFKDRLDEPVDDRPLGDPPMHLDAKHRVCWGEIERISAPGVLRFGDRIAVEMTSVLLASFRELGPAMPDQKLRRLESMLGQLGLTPAARTKVKAVGQHSSRNDFLALGKPPSAGSR
ncbi:P27 family phage terminase small subunit [Stenotrophomonas rhizophila]|uniref:P27 family phage terminase small subunit n=1 Tax=Stenotrophomonas rhizophila TaxID=216778 RepID=UPI00117D6C5B|nr:P27 family phage terminase small subunit [Stenotrophomonas rhizophila]